jgi:ParB/RepB/Spo0J family partition protein
MAKKHAYVFQELPLDKIQEDQYQPRQDLGVSGEENGLLLSIGEYGIEQPIVVSEDENGKYTIIDGHRRFDCAKKLGLTTVPCRIYPKLSPGEFESRRYQIQNNRRPWRPPERAEAFARIKQLMGFEKNIDLAHFLHVSVTVVSTSLQLKNDMFKFVSVMERHGFSNSYEMEFIRLKPKMRKIKDLEFAEIVRIIFDKVDHKVIRSAKDFRKLGRVFLRAGHNEDELYRFLSDPDMRVDELEQQSVESGFSLHIEQLIKKINENQNNGVEFQDKEKLFLTELHQLLEKVL